MLRSTADASLASVVAEPSRDGGAGCGGASDLGSTLQSVIRRPDWECRSSLRYRGLPVVGAVGGASVVGFEVSGSAAAAGAFGAGCEVLVGSGATVEKYVSSRIGLGYSL